MKIKQYSNVERLTSVTELVNYKLKIQSCENIFILKDKYKSGQKCQVMRKIKETKF